MHEDLLKTLETLSCACAPAGYETEARRILRTLVAEHVDESRVDALGNLITCLKAADAAAPLTVMVAAHMDEVGFMVTEHTGDGFLRIAPIGGVDARLLPGSELRVLARPPLSGVVGLKAIHRAREGYESVPKVDQLVVDIGASSKEEAQRLAPVGTALTFPPVFKALGPTVMGKAFDDRAGCTALVELLRRGPYPHHLYGVFTVQEEVGLRGAQVAAYGLAPDVAFVVEGTIADDLPKDGDESPTSRLGGGVVLTAQDSSYITPPRLLDFAIGVARELGIPYQIKQPGIGGTDAGAIHKVRAGVPALALAVPCRYIHGPLALLNVEDLAHTVRLLQALVERINPDVLPRS